MGDYQQAYDKSVSDPEGYWAEQAELIDWFRKPTRVLDDDNPPFYRWYPDATLNTCYNALDRHVAKGAADRLALIYDSPVADAKATYTYAQLLEQVAAFGGVLRSLGVSQGDRVVIYMPMIPEAVIAMLACARIGAVHSVVFGGFAPHELAVRIDDAKPTVLVTAGLRDRAQSDRGVQAVRGPGTRTGRAPGGHGRGQAAAASRGLDDRGPGH